MLAGADVSPVVAADARVERTGARAKQVRRDNTDLTSGSYSDTSTVIGARP